MFFFISLFLLLKPVYTSWKEVSQCFTYLCPSVQRDGDLVLGGFFPIYYVNQGSDVSRLSFLFPPKTEVTAMR